jgi:hypothetical protein
MKFSLFLILYARINVGVLHVCYTTVVSLSVRMSIYPLNIVFATPKLFGRF